MTGRRGRPLVPLGGENVVTRVLEIGRPARMDSYASATASLAAEARALGIGSSVGVPITVAGRLWGVMIASSTYESALPAGTEQRLADFTELVATAIGDTQARRSCGRSRTSRRRCAGWRPGRASGAAGGGLRGGRRGGRAADSSRSQRSRPLRLRRPRDAWWATGAGRTTTASPARASAWAAERDHARVRDPATGAAGHRRRLVRRRRGARRALGGQRFGRRADHRRGSAVGSDGSRPRRVRTRCRLTPRPGWPTSPSWRHRDRQRRGARRADGLARPHRRHRRPDQAAHRARPARRRPAAAGLAGPAAARRRDRDPPRAERGPGRARRRRRRAGCRPGRPAGTVARHPSGHPVRGRPQPGPADPGPTLPGPGELQVQLGTRARLPERIEVTAYYVVSEALTNVAKHANASVVQVNVDSEDGLSGWPSATTASAAPTPPAAPGWSASGTGWRPPAGPCAWTAAPDRAPPCWSSCRSTLVSRRRAPPDLTGTMRAAPGGDRPGSSVSAALLLSRPASGGRPRRSPRRGAARHR